MDTGGPALDLSSEHRALARDPAAEDDDGPRHRHDVAGVGPTAGRPLAPGCEVLAGPPLGPAFRSSRRSGPDGGPGPVDVCAPGESPHRRGAAPLASPG